MHIIGTAGHVDHGKSSLVLALTGTNPDRWLEEQVRGMTLDLGFARLDLGDGVEAGIVDVPGHERFLHNMLAGAAGMELLLLVVAANEGPRPQTREHLAIVSYLNVRRALIVLTKADLVGDEELALAEEAVREAAQGTVAEHARAVATSSVSGRGLDELRAAIREELLALPPRPLDAPAYLPIDRSFALQGHGTIVTGTLMQGRMRVGEELMLQPGERRVRVRGLHVFNRAFEDVSAGSRVAVNLPGIDYREIRRGMTLGAPELAPRDTLTVCFRPPQEALSMLRRRTKVRAHLGSAEILGTLVFEHVPERAEEVEATLHLREPALAFPGSTFVVRRMSPKDLLGGGTVAGVGVRIQGAEEGEESPEAAALADALAASGRAPLSLNELAARANVRAERAAREIAALVEDGRVLELAKPLAYLDGVVGTRLLAAASETLAARHERAPWALGLQVPALARAMAVEEPLGVRLLAVFAHAGSLAQRGVWWSLPSFTPQLSKEQQRFFGGVLAVAPQTPLVPVALALVLERIAASKVEGLADALETLFVGGALVKVSDEVYRRSQIQQIRAHLEEMLRAKGELTMAEFRNIVGTSRKYCVPLLEWFDATGVTVRAGDVRRLRQAVR
ncbi:selenocysteine-specific translation elongation factor [bacterium]|nr:MAG: selenocysteine-specific translation elongation factor [bacterium]